MAELFIEGFDKYGAPGTSTLYTLILSEWTVAGNGISITSPLSSTGYSIFASGGSGSVTKTLPGNFTRIVGGVRFKSDLGGSAGNWAGYIALGDGGTVQAGVAINSGTGFIEMYGHAGNNVVEIASTTTVSIHANSIHYLEWDITMGASGAYFVYLDGVLILSGNGVTNGGTGVSQINQFSLGGGTGSCVFDDLYVFDTSGVVNNAVLLTNPRIETQFPAADSQAQFSNGGAILGSTIQSGATSNDYLYKDVLHLRALTPPVNMTLNSLVITSGSAPYENFTAVIYSDLAGVADTLLGQSADTAGTTASTQILDMLVPVALTAGTQYWVGVMYTTDILLNIQGRIGVGSSDGLLEGVSVARTYGLGPPATAPTMLLGRTTYRFYGYCTNVAHNWASENLNPPFVTSEISYIYSSTPGDEDLYLFPSLTTHPTNIYTVAVKAYARLTDTGNRSIDLRMKSVATDSAGSNSGIVPPTSYQWCDSFFTNDPNTAAPWNESGLNAAASGIKVAT